MVRTILTPEHTDIHLTIPEAYIGKPVEVTFLALDELECQREKTMNNFFISKPKTRLSDKYRGVFSKDAGKSFKEHTQLMREEWNNS